MINEEEEKTVVTEVPAEEVAKADEQPNDLEHQVPEETDNLQKSAIPDTEYMKSHSLDPDTHGKKNW